MSSHDEMPDEELWERSQSDELEDRADALLELAHRARNREDLQVAKSLYGSRKSNARRACSAGYQSTKRQSSL